jgi:hypothetical protein
MPSLFAGLALRVRYMEKSNGLLLRDFAKAVVSHSGPDARVGGKLLNNGNVSPGIQEIGNEGPPKIVWRKRCDSYLGSSFV